MRKKNKNCQLRIMSILSSAFHLSSDLKRSPNKPNTDGQLDISRPYGTELPNTKYVRAVLQSEKYCHRCNCGTSFRGVYSYWMAVIKWRPVLFLLDIRYSSHAPDEAKKKKRKYKGSYIPSLELVYIRRTVELKIPYSRPGVQQDKRIPPRS